MPRRSARPASGRTILVVDDQEATLTSVRTLLEREGHAIVTAQSGEEALRQLQSVAPQVMIVDYFMPRMTGAQLVEQVRALDPFVQIVLQTGYSGEAPPRRVLAELDIQGYHDKGDDPERLLMWLDVALKTHDLVTTLRRREQLQGELVANCSHEFRTPLNIIAGYAELMREGDFGQLPEPALAPLDSLLHATRGLADLVEDFLSYARLDAGVMDVTREEIDTAELAAELERLAQLLIAGKPLAFRIDVSAAPRRFASDPVKIRIILRNLIGNAVKFTDRGVVELRIARTAGALRLGVRDTGCGIAPDELEHVFDAFAQGDGSTTRRHGGVGLGLALARKTALLLDGDLEVVSQPGVGSTFTLVLPAPVGSGDTAPTRRTRAGLPLSLAG
jgi:signal transduction histidine kinase